MKEPLELNEDTIDILGMVSFQCIGMAEILRSNGQVILNKAEHEQAAVIHYLLNMYLEHGKDWRNKAIEHFNTLYDKHKTLKENIDNG